MNWCVWECLVLVLNLSQNETWTWLELSCDLADMWAWLMYIVLELPGPAFAATWTVLKNMWDEFGFLDFWFEQCLRAVLDDFKLVLYTVLMNQKNAQSDRWQVSGKTMTVKAVARPPILLHCINILLMERLEQWNVEAAKMVEEAQHWEEMISIDETPKSPATNHYNLALEKQEMTLADMIFEKLNNTKPERLDNEVFIQRICKGYPSDKLLSLIIQEPQGYQSFVVRDNLVWTKNVYRDDVLCLPRDRKLILDVLSQAHY